MPDVRGRLAVPVTRRSSSNRVGCKGFLRCRCRKHGRLRGRQLSPHDGASRATLPRFITHFGAVEALSATSVTEWISLRPGRTSRAPCGADELVDQAVAGVSLNGSPVISMLCMTTASLRATATAARLDPSRSHSCSPHLRRSHSDRLRVRSTVAALYRQPSQMTIAAPGDVTVIIDFAGLVAPGGQPDPGTDRS